MNTLFDKIWDSHVVSYIEQGPDVLYIDRHLLHEVTSPQAFNGLQERGIKVARPDRCFATCDHNVPTLHQELPIKDDSCRIPIEKLAQNTSKYGITHFGLCHPYQGVIHVMAPEQGITLPGQTIVCGDSHTATHGAFGSVAFGIGTSEVEMALSTQCIMQPKPRTMLIQVNGKLGKCVTSKDLILHIISKMTTGGCTGYFVEYSGSAIKSLSMEARMTLCNMSIEMGARGGLIAPDEKTFEYIKGRNYAPKGEEWERAMEYWTTLHSDSDAQFDKVVQFDGSDVEPMITYGTNPGMGMRINDTIPQGADEKALEYMGFSCGESLIGKRIDYIFLGSCTNGRIEDFRMFADVVKGKRRSPEVIVWLVPGSGQVLRQIKEEGIDRILEDAGFELRQPGCSACLAMNDDKVPTGCYCLSTSNRNFEGRQGIGARTILASPIVAAAAAITGIITDPRTI